MTADQSGKLHPISREASLLAIGGPAHGRRGPWGKHADPDGYVLLPVPGPVVFVSVEPGRIPSFGDGPPRYRVVRVLLPGWRVSFWAAVHMPWPRRSSWQTDERLGLADGAVLPGSRVGVVEPLREIAVGVHSHRIMWPVTQWCPGNWLPGPFRPRDVPLDSELDGLLEAGITLDEWRAGARP